ncbi:MAG: PKD domain-containing protein [Candidatus Helarchaeota archaeon]
MNRITRGLIIFLFISLLVFADFNTKTTHLQVTSTGSNLLKSAGDSKNCNCYENYTICSNMTLSYITGFNDTIISNSSVRVVEVSTEYINEKMNADVEFKTLLDLIVDAGYSKCQAKYRLVDIKNSLNNIFIGLRSDEGETDIIYVLNYEALNKTYLIDLEIDGNNDTLLSMYDLENGFTVNLNNGTIIQSWGHHSCDYWRCFWGCYEAILTGIVGSICGIAIATICSACIVTIISPEPYSKTVCIACLIALGLCLGLTALVCTIGCKADPCSYGHTCYPGSIRNKHCTDFSVGYYHTLVYELCSDDGLSWTTVYVYCGASGMVCDPTLLQCVTGPTEFAPLAIAGLDKTVVEDDIVFFDGSASYDTNGYIVYYSWDFGDGTFGAGVNPQHQYTTAGVYTVTLEVIDDEGLTDSDELLVTVNNIEPLAIAGPDQETIVGESILFDGSNSLDTPSDLPLLSYYWDFGDGTSEIGMTTFHRYTECGEYTVTLTVTDDDGASDVDSLIVLVKPILAVIDIDPDTLNLKSKGNFITAYIEIPQYDASKIDLSSISINNTISVILDSKYGFVSNPAIEDRDNDGNLEMMVKFGRETIQSYVSEGNVFLLITGEIAVTLNGIEYYLPLEGIDVIRVI